eukprot:6327411-Pyramimonas_sp.AAC.1
MRPLLTSNRLFRVPPAGVARRPRGGPGGGVQGGRLTFGHAGAGAGELPEPLRVPSEGDGPDRTAGGTRFQRQRRVLPARRHAGSVPRAHPRRPRVH